MAGGAAEGLGVGADEVWWRRDGDAVERLWCVIGGCAVAAAAVGAGGVGAGAGGREGVGDVVRHRRPDHGREIHLRILMMHRRGTATGTRRFWRGGMFLNELPNKENLGAMPTSRSGVGMRAARDVPWED